MVCPFAGPVKAPTACDAGPLGVTDASEEDSLTRGVAAAANATNASFP